MGVLHAFIEAIEQLRNLASHIPGIAPLVQEVFLLRPFTLLLVLGVATGVVGTLVNLRRVEFNAEVMIHSVFPGIVVGFAFRGTDVISFGVSLTALPVVAALILVEHTEVHHGSGTAAVLTTFFGLGIVISPKKGDMSGQLEAPMFGHLLGVTDARLLQSFIAYLLAPLLVIATRKEDILAAHDREGARVMGISLLAVDLALNCTITAIVISASSAVGALPVITYLIVPRAAGHLISANVGKMCVIPILAAALDGWLGMCLMLVLAPYPVSPWAVVVFSIVALLVLIIAGLGVYTVPHKTMAPKVKTSAESELQGMDV